METVKASHFGLNSSPDTNAEGVIPNPTQLRGIHSVSARGLTLALGEKEGRRMQTSRAEPGASDHITWSFVKLGLHSHPSSDATIHDEYCCSLPHSSSHINCSHCFKSPLHVHPTIKLRERKFNKARARRRLRYINKAYSIRSRESQKTTSTRRKRCEERRDLLFISSSSSSHHQSLPAAAVDHTRVQVDDK